MAIHRSQLRTKATVEAGFTSRYDDGPVTVVDYCPGNGTRYTLTVAHIRVPSSMDSYPDDALLQRQDPSGAAKLMAVAPDGGIVVAYDQRHTSQVFSNGGFVHWSYLLGRLTNNEADAIVLAEVVAYFTGGEAVTPDQYERSTTASDDDEDE